MQLFPQDICPEDDSEMAHLLGFKLPTGPDTNITLSAVRFQIRQHRYLKGKKKHAKLGFLDKGLTIEGFVVCLWSYYKDLSLNHLNYC